MYDTDHFTLDDWMAQSKTDAYGRFKLTGFANEFTHINPKLNVYHNCNNDLSLHCKWKLSIYIPKTYISKSTIPKVFDAGVLNLDGKFKGQERDCFH
uniref:Transthyretin-like family protein n=1 Tax=Globodera pallida TaxID=36090 RepID=A0A183BXX2_GLOPA